MNKLLIWCAGDVSKYRTVDYIIEDRPITSFLSPSALYKHLSPTHLLVFIPETLFKSDHERSYILLIKAKCGYTEDNMKYRLFSHSIGNDNELTIKENINLDNFIRHLEDSSRTKIVRVPHPGRANALSLEEVIRDREKCYVIKYVNIKGSGNFNSIVNVIFHNIIKAVREFKISEIHVDLTHGTNVIVQALMLSVAMIRSLLDDVKINLWVAPITPPAGEKGEVYFENISELLETIHTLTSVSTAVKLLDDRPLSNVLNYVNSLGSKLGPCLRSIYGITQRTSKEFKKMLWIFRSNQLMIMPRYVDKISKMLKNSENNVRKFIEDYIINERWKSLQTSDKPLIPFVEYVLTKFKENIENVYSENPLEIIIKSLRSMYNSGYYIQILLIIRELIILLLLAWLGFKEIKIGSEEWQKIDNILKKKESEQIIYNELVREFPQMEELKDLILKKLIQYFSKLIEFRNKFAHGLIVRESIVRINSLVDWVKKGDSDLEEINIDRVIGLAKEGIEIIDRLFELLKKRYGW